MKRQKQGLERGQAQAPSNWLKIGIPFQLDCLTQIQEIHRAGSLWVQDKKVHVVMWMKINPSSSPSSRIPMLAMDGCSYKAAAGGSLSNNLVALAKLGCKPIGGPSLNVAMAGNDPLGGFFRLGLITCFIYFFSLVVCIE